MKIGEKREVVYAELHDGTLVTEEMTLINIFQYYEDEVYIFKDNEGYLIASYEFKDDKIDWGFMEEINDVFIE